VGRNDPKWIQEGRNFKVLKIRQNQCHCVGLIVPIPAIFFFSENGHRMWKLSCSELSPKQAKKSQSQSQLMMSLERNDDVSMPLIGWHRSTKRWHVSVKFGIFRMSWHDTEVTRDTVWKWHMEVWMLTWHGDMWKYECWCGRTNDDVEGWHMAVQMLMWHCTNADVALYEWWHSTVQMMMWHCMDADVVAN